MTATYESEWEALPEMEFEGELELEGEGELEGEFESEYELEFEGEGELESGISPVRKIYADAMMEHLGHMAAESESEQEAAEHFLPLIGMAAKKLLPVVAKAVSPALRRAIPRVARAVTKMEPRLTRGITKIARGLYRQPATRGLLRAVPTIARRTVLGIAKQAAKGRPITARSAIRTLATQTRNVLGHRRRRHHALRKSQVMDRKLHRHVGPRSIRPHWRRYYGGGYAPGMAAPGVPAHPGIPGTPVYGHGGVATHPAYRPHMPATGGYAGHPYPIYCQCCGQPLR